MLDQKLVLPFIRTLPCRLEPLDLQTKYQTYRLQSKVQLIHLYFPYVCPLLPHARQKMPSHT